ncbi:MAG: hypothetical protein IPJ51_13895 [Saprospiraceae bacterium]|nr:hypothetical protein [Saprospiraceae bacterium]
MKFISVLILISIFSIYSCKENYKLEFVKDPTYFNPAYRLTDTVGRKLAFSFHARYFVFGFHHNRFKFDSVIHKMVCNMLAGDTLLTKISLSFEDYGKFSYYQNGEILSSDFTDHIAYIYWEIENPYYITELSKGETFSEKAIPFKCVLKHEHIKIINRPDYRKTVPSKLKTKKVIFKHLNFKVMTNLSSMPINGIFAVSLLNKGDIRKVSSVLEKARVSWNTQSEKAREKGQEFYERGICDSIVFKKLEDKLAYWYIDAGSAHEGIHEFLLQGLSESGIKIKHVEIQGM